MREIVRPTHRAEQAGSIRRGRLLIAMTTTLVTLVLGVVGGSSPVGAHDDIAGSTPASRATIDEPISTVEIDFGELISDDVSMFLTYDKGGAKIEDLGGTTVKTGDTTARLDFDEIDREGTYFVQYLAPVPADGHVMAGAITFTYGKPSGSGTDFPWIPFLALSTPLVATGAWLSYRRMLVPVGEAPSEPLTDASDLV
jgi:methionine-rich copper-binding protein CopC